MFMCNKLLSHCYISIACRFSPLRKYCEIVQFELSHVSCNYNKCTNNMSMFFFNSLILFISVISFMMAMKSTENTFFY